MSSPLIGGPKRVVACDEQFIHSAEILGLHLSVAKCGLVFLFWFLSIIAILSQSFVHVLPDDATFLGTSLNGRSVAYSVQLWNAAAQICSEQLID
jgi:hypothetical protein